MYTGLLTNHSHICIHVFCTFSVLKVNSPSSCLYKTDGASSLIPKFSVFFFFFFLKSPSVDFSEKLAMRTQSWSPSGSITHAGCWWRHRSWERDPAWCSWWRWDGPHAKAAAPARLFPETETGQPAPHNLIDQETQLMQETIKRNNMWRVNCNQMDHQPWSEEINL